MKMRRVDGQDGSWWVEWRKDKVVFGLSIESDGEAGWYYLDFSKDNVNERSYERGDIDKEKLRELYLHLQEVFK